MPIRDYLLTELDAEMKKTRTVLERLPSDKGEYVPHTKSMPFGKLAAHCADLLNFGMTVLSKPGLDFGVDSFQRTPFESGGQLARVVGERAAALRAVLQGVDDSAWAATWNLSFNGKQIYAGARILAYREMFMNHLIHHRAQLGVYMRLNGIPLPWMYGPTADEPFTG